MSDLTLAGLPLVTLALAMIAALVAAFVRGLAGFGMAILLVPLLGLVVLPVEAVVVSNFLGLLIGLIALAATPPALARFVIALVAMAAFLAVLLPVRPGHRPGTVETGLTGISSGLLTGFAGMPGPPVVPFYLRRGLPAVVARASMMSIFLCTSLASSVIALALGLAGARHALLALLLFAPVLAGDWIGRRAFGRVSDRAWRGFVGLVLGAAGIAALVRLLP